MNPSAQYAQTCFDCKRVLHPSEIKNDTLNYCDPFCPAWHGPTKSMFGMLLQYCRVCGKPCVTTVCGGYDVKFEGWAKLSVCSEPCFKEGETRRYLSILGTDQDIEAQRNWKHD